MDEDNRNIFKTYNENIVIKMIKLLDENDKYVKFVKLKDVVPYLSKMNVKFKKQIK